MIAGRMKHKLIVYERSEETLSNGSEKVTYVKGNTIHAERLSLNGRLSMEVAELFSDYDATYNVRTAHDIEEGWRVLEVGGNLYTVCNIYPNIKKGYNTLLCQRVNE